MALTELKRGRLPTPGAPKGGFLTGHLREWTRDRLGFLTRCAREYGDFVPLRFGPWRSYLLSHPDSIEQVLVTDSRRFRKSYFYRINRALLGNGLLTSEGDFWLRQRRLAQPAFHRNRIAGYGEVMVAYTNRMLDRWQEGETRDILEEMMTLTMEIVAEVLFDADVAEDAREVGVATKVLRDLFSARIDSMLRIPEYLPTPANLRRRREVRRLNRIVYGIIERRRGSWEDRGDLLSTLLHAHDEDGSRMTDEQVRDEVMTLFLAGHETTAIALAWTWYLLARHPEVEAKLQAEIQSVLGDRTPTPADLTKLPYTEMVIWETLRLYPPVWAISREAVTACEVGGHWLPKGATVAISQWILHRDPRYFEHPDDFEPERWQDGLARRLPRFAYFPFGGGQRHCIGSSFAVMEAILILVTVAQQFHLSLAGDRVQPEPSITLRPKGGLRLVLHRRSTQVADRAPEQASAQHRSAEIL